MEKISQNILIRIISFLFSMLLLNFIIWSSFHSTHHLFTDKVIDNQYRFIVNSCLNSDDTSHHHKKTSSPNQKKHHQQSDIGCFLLNFNSSCEEYSIFFSKKIAKNYKDITKEKIITKIFINISLLILSELIPRAPPMSQLN